MAYEEIDIVKRCRCCLNAIYNNAFSPVENCISQMMEELFIKVNLGVSGNPIICNNCAVKLQDFFDFKWKCLITENVIHSLKDTKENSTLHLKEINLNENEDNVDGISEDHKMCRFCGKITKYEYTQLHDTKENIFMISVLQNHIPGLSLNITEELIACKLCFDSLKSLHSFTTTCADVEKKITKYADIEGPDDNGHIQLNNIAQFTYNDDLVRAEEGVNCDKIKTENLLEEYKVDMSIKHEEIDLKAELTDSDSEDMAATPQLDILKYKCPKCSFETKFRRSLRCHNLNHQSPPEVTMCESDICHYKSKQKMLQTNMHKCDLCSYTAKYKSHVNIHMLMHKGPLEVTLYKCAACTFAAKHKRSLQRHSIVHKEPAKIRNVIRMFKCDLCSYEGRKGYDLRRHTLSHKGLSEITLLECEKCTFKTKYKDSLRNHMKIHKNPAELRTFKCDICSYHATQLCNLKRHMITHKNLSEVTLFECYKCSFKSKYKYYLAKHMIVHKDRSEVTTYKCYHCEFDTKYKKSLRQHMVIHGRVSVGQ